MGNNSHNLDDDDDDESDHSYVPSESELESFSEESSEEEEDEEEHSKDGGQKIKPDFTTPVTGKKSKGMPRVTPTKTSATSSRRTKSREKVSFSALTNDSQQSYCYFFIWTIYTKNM